MGYSVDRDPKKAASRFDELTGFVSLTFAHPPQIHPGQPWRVGVKVIDPRGNEGLRVITLPAD